MRFIVTPEFSKKAVDLGVDVLVALGKFLSFIGKSGKPQIVAESIPTVATDGAPIFVYRSVGVFFVFTFDEDKEGEYLLVADLAVDQSSFATENVSRRMANEDPRSNRQLNPNLNSKMNPTFNSRINPTFNSQINPTFNSQINPRFNSKINPTFNSKINPKFNSNINPNFNSALNPSYNWSIDPQRNTTAKIRRLYDLELNVTGFVVRASDDILLVFDNKKAFVGYTVETKMGNLNYFSENGDWLEYWVPLEQERFLRFNLDANWLGSVI